jgi:hypothetical protein
MIQQDTLGLIRKKQIRKYVSESIIEASTGSDAESNQNSGRILVVKNSGIRMDFACLSMPSKVIGDPLREQ